MNFYDLLQAKYEPKLNKSQFKDVINNFENQIFDKYPFLCELFENEQNAIVELMYRNRREFSWLDQL